MSAKPPPGEDAIAALAGLARREVGGEGPAGASDRDEARERALAGFRSVAGRRRPAAPALTWMAAAALAGLVALGIALAFPAFFAEPPLGFTLEGVHAADDGGLAGGYVPSGATARFSDGSVIAFGGGAGGRVAEVGPHGARVLLEGGTASFQIVHRPGARWSVEAGPFVIAVIGTAFDASWSAGAQALEVRLHEGEVSVGGVRLRAGQRLAAHAADGAIEIGPIVAPTATPAPAQTTTEAPSPPEAAPPATPVPSASAAALTAAAPPGAAASGAALGWPKRVAAGDFLGVVAAAVARGVEATLRRVSLADLVAVADAARYAGRDDLARRALLAERARFAGAAESHAAAFLLGRLADDAGGSPEAIRWYDAYLAEAPHGAFAADALGRKLAALRRAHDPAARAAAAEYLERYPEGPYAGAARELLAAP